MLTGIVVLVASIPLVTLVPALAAGARHLRRHATGVGDSIRVLVVDLGRAIRHLWLLGVVLLFVQPAYALDYTIEEAHQTFTLTGITIGVGLFGGYAAIVAVYLGIAGFSPRPADPEDAPSAPIAPATAEAATPADPNPQKDSA